MVRGEVAEQIVCTAPVGHTAVRDAPVGPACVPPEPSSGNFPYERPFGHNLSYRRIVRSLLFREPTGSSERA